MNTNKRRIVVGISGASGVPVAVEVLRALQVHSDIEVHLILSEQSALTIAQESDLSAEEICALADVVHDPSNLGASVASGSFRCEGMIIVPCSMKTLAAIACGFSENLLLRAADVTLKERRRLVLVARECPLSPIHLRNMLLASEAGATILPMMMTFYQRPKRVCDMTRHLAGKILDCFGLDMEEFHRWNGI